ncbi:MAG: MCP four helix bundle domain-containing protein, partial [Anaerolineales bacterium]|nr:MCP four helix bundle domain-containing protein [Anaerolineales bacterium]
MKLNIRNKLLLAFALIVMFTGGVGFIGYDSTNKINQMLNTMYDNHLAGVVHVQKSLVSLYSIRAAVRSTLLATTEQQKQEQEIIIQAAVASFEENMAAYEETIVTDQARTIYKQLMVDFGIYVENANDILQLSNENQNEAAVQLLWDTSLIAKAIEDSVEELIVSKETLAKDFAADSNTMFIQARNSVVGLAIFSMFLGFVIAFFLSQSISKAAQQMAGVAEGIAKGELD